MIIAPILSIIILQLLNIFLNINVNCVLLFTDKSNSVVNRIKMYN